MYVIKVLSLFINDVYENILEYPKWRSLGYIMFNNLIDHFLKPAFV